jgi:hypothetical protein
MVRRLDRRLVRLGSVMVGAALLWHAGVTAQTASKQEQAALPTGREIVDRFVDLIGGAGAIASVTSYRARGAFELTDQGIAGSIEILAARPNRHVVRVDVPGVGEILSGYDGKVGWTISPASGPALLTDTALEQAAEDAVFEAVLHPPAMTTELVTVGQTVFNGQQSYQVKVVYRSGRESFEYYDVVTGMKLGTEGRPETEFGATPTTTFLYDYESFGPLKQATRIVQRPLGFEQVVRLTSFDYDQVPDDAFDLPPSIKALIR